MSSFRLFPLLKIPPINRQVSTPRRNIVRKRSGAFCGRTTFRTPVRILPQGRLRRRCYAKSRITRSARSRLCRRVLVVYRKEQPITTGQNHCAAGSDGDTNFGVALLAAPIFSAMRKTFYRYHHDDKLILPHRADGIFGNGSRPFCGITPGRACGRRAMRCCRSARGNSCRWQERNCHAAAADSFAKACTSPC